MTWWMALCNADSYRCIPNGYHFVRAANALTTGRVHKQQDKVIDAGYI